MSHSAVTFEELLADHDVTATKWKQFFETNPDAASVPTDIAGSKNISELVWHIYAASFRLAQRLLGEELSDPGSVHDIPAAFALKDEAVKKFRQFLSNASEATLEETFEFKSRLVPQPITGTKRKLCLHAFVHAIRHWAQIGTLVRLADYSLDWPQDILFSEAIQ